MPQVPFDTINIVERLVEAGLPRDHAKEHASILVDVVSDFDARMAARYPDAASVVAEMAALRKAVDTSASNNAHEFVQLRNELALVRSDGKRDIDVLRSEIKQGLAQNRAELIRWVVTVGLLQSALISGLLTKIVP